MKTEKKRDLLKRRRWRIRKRIVGTKERPRMSVTFSGKNIYVQFIDDEAGKTLGATSTRSKTLSNRDKLAANVASATQIGGNAAEVAKSQGIDKVVFDRRGAQYHGKVKALADAARENGLEF